MSSGLFQEMTTPDLAGVKEAVVAGLVEIFKGFGRDQVRMVPDGQGGVWIKSGDRTRQCLRAGGELCDSCCLPFNLPAADVYPLFLRPDLSRLDGGILERDSLGPLCNGLAIRS